MPGLLKIPLTSISRSAILKTRAVPRLHVWEVSGDAAGWGTVVDLPGVAGHVSRPGKAHFPKVHVRVPGRREAGSGLCLMPFALCRFGSGSSNINAFRENCGPHRSTTHHPAISSVARRAEREDGRTRE